MNQRNNLEKNRQFSQKLLQFGMGIMAIFYVILGFLVIDKKWLMVNLEEKIAYSLGILLIIYGLYRGWRAIQNFKEISKN